MTKFNIYIYIHTHIYNPCNKKKVTKIYTRHQKKKKNPWQIDSKLKVSLIYSVYKTKQNIKLFELLILWECEMEKWMMFWTGMH